MSDTIDFAKLAALFDPKEIEWRAGATNGDKTKAMAVAYITSRAIMNRLDAVVGPENWRDNYMPGPSGGVMCGLSIRVNGEWITKYDGADNSDIEAVKGGFSDAIKRAAVKWGIGRYLYDLDGQWVRCEVFGKTIKLSEQPKLPVWAIPGGKKQPVDTPAAQPAPNGNSHEPEAEAAPQTGHYIVPKGESAPNALVSSGICDNVPAASALLSKHVPQSIRGDAQKVVDWGYRYRGYRDADKSVEEAAKLASA